MLSSSFYSGYSIISHYKQIILNQSIIDQFINSSSYTELINQINQQYQSVQMSISGIDSIANVEKKLEEKMKKIFMDLSRFFSGRMKSFNKIFFSYFSLLEATTYFKNNYWEPAEDYTAQDIFSPFIQEHIILKDKKPYVFYETRLFQIYFDYINELFDLIEIDELSYEIIEYWSDLLNIVAIKQLMNDYEYTFEETLPLLILWNKKHNHLLYQSVFENKKISSKNPFLINIDLEQDDLKAKMNHEFRVYLIKKMGGNPFRYSYYISFFLILLIDYELMIRILNAKYYNLKPEKIKQLSFI